jgi:hypothetical protein
VNKKAEPLTPVGIMKRSLCLWICRTATQRKIFWE